ncbi:hypothetical protein [Ornithobacterium rhinotracheale]|uniref:hypothetical protein n=1 Tax=Ornithobacterium rhinotracheale TaxID=28251 RepID=UPI004036859A
MDNLRRSIRLLFADYCPDYILQTKNAGEHKDYINLQKFLENGYSSFSNYSLDEICNVFKKLKDDWFIDPETKKENYFHILNHFNSKVLSEQNNEPFVIYKHLLKWRHLSHYTGEDFLTTSFFAYSDLISQRKRSFFAWRGTSFSNNKRLRQVLEKGLAENHFHLKGSGPVFVLSWLNLMNNPTKYDCKFKKLEEELSLTTKYSNANIISNKELKILVYKAAYIRFKLFCLVNQISTDLDLDITKPSNSDSSFDLLINIHHLSREINALKYDQGHKFIYNNDKPVIDYAIPQNIHHSNLKKSYVFYGERKLMYQCFQKIFDNDLEFKKHIHLFHVYLLIKAQFRAELIQINDKFGFGNFYKYQNRKEYFLPDDSIYHTAFINLAVNDTKKQSNIKSFELRIAPKDEVSKINSSLHKYNLAIDKKAIQSLNNYKTPKKIKFKNTYNLEKENIFYTIHFIKKEDKYDSISSELICRHHHLRNEIKRQSIAITKLRESYSVLSKHIRGIDAASSEFNTPPEVFSQAFRYLKNHKLKGELNHLKDNIEEPRIYATYHVGEDFYDIVDGLRAIDEAIKFCTLSQGDRIGHALALGIDIKEYYNLKGNKLMLPKQMVLDNIVWLLAKIRKYGISIHRNEVNRLEKLFENLYYEIYSSNMTNEKFKEKYINHITYFNAWKLRGDDPYLYQTNIESDLSNFNLTYWDRCRINEWYPKNKNIRENIDCKRILQAYHFNKKIKKRGREIKQFKITHAYAALVEAVQRKFMHEIKSYNISIETNPTSNYLIGTFERYAKHPITKFFNLGLEINSEKIKDCPQLSVSINTDDQGIFSTSLENEYALMAIALEKEKNELGEPKYSPSMIYEYLEKIRIMGIEQSFSS